MPQLRDLAVQLILRWSLAVLLILRGLRGIVVCMCFIMECRRVFVG